MTFKPIRGVYNRMPVFFGPAPGPRQGRPGRPPFDYSDTRFTTLGTRFLTRAHQLEKWLPGGFELWGEPVLTVDATYITRLPWLAGRGYSLSDIKCEVIYHSKSGPVHGTLVFVRFESLTDPILSGREELGHNKLYCEIPDYRVHDGKYAVTMSWLNSPFATLECWDFVDSPGAGMPPEHRGQMAYKYMPRTGDWGVPDVEYVTLSPNLQTPNAPPVRCMTGKGSVHWTDPVWEDLPTLYHIVGACHELEQVEQRGSFYVELVGGNDVSSTIALD